MEAGEGCGRAREWHSPSRVAQGRELDVALYFGSQGRQRRGGEQVLEGAVQIGGLRSGPSRGNETDIDTVQRGGVGL